MRLPGFAIRNHRITILLYLAFLILGIGGILNMPASEDPPVDPPTVSIYAFYSGTSPVDMERLVVEPLEEAINELEGIKELGTKIEVGLAKLVVI